MNKEGFIEDDLDRLLYYRTLEAGVFLGGLMCPVSILALIKERKNRKKIGRSLVTAVPSILKPFRSHNQQDAVDMRKCI